MQKERKDRLLLALPRALKFQIFVALHGIVGGIGNRFENGRTALVQRGSLDCHLHLIFWYNYSIAYMYRLVKQNEKNMLSPKHKKADAPVGVFPAIASAFVF